MCVLLTIRSAPVRSSGMRPSACVTSTATSAGECLRTASTTSGRRIVKPLKKLTSDTVTSRVRGPSSGHQVFGPQRPGAAPPDLGRRRARRLEPRRGPGREVEVVDDHLVPGLWPQGQGRQVVRLRRARADADLGRRQAEELAGQLPRRLPTAPRGPSGRPCRAACRGGTVPSPAPPTAAECLRRLCSGRSDRPATGSRGGGMSSVSMIPSRGVARSSRPRGESGHVSGMNRASKLC